MMCIEERQCDVWQLNAKVWPITTFKSKQNSFKKCSVLVAKKFHLISQFCSCQNDSYVIGHLDFWKQKFRIYWEIKILLANLFLFVVSQIVLKQHQFRDFILHNWTSYRAGFEIPWIRVMSHWLTQNYSYRLI